MKSPKKTRKAAANHQNENQEEKETKNHQRKSGKSDPPLIKIDPSSPPDFRSLFYNLIHKNKNNTMETEITTCSIGAMLGNIDMAKKYKKWLCILDTNGNAGVFMKYKSTYIPAFEHSKDGNIPEEDKMINWIFGALRGGGLCCFDFDSFGNQKSMKIDEWFSSELGFGNFFEPEKFLEYGNIVKLGQKYPKVVEAIVGENKVLFTPEEDPAFFVFVVKSETVPKWAAEKGLTILKVT